MLEDFKKLIEKKKKEGKELDPMAAKAKGNVLSALQDDMHGMMKDDLQKAKMGRVEVASNTPEGLKTGLKKAEDLLDPKEVLDEAGSEEEPSEEEGEPAAEMHETELSDEDIAMLEKVLEQAKAKRV